MDNAQCVADQNTICQFKGDYKRAAETEGPPREQAAFIGDGEPAPAEGVVNHVIAVRACN
jgi:hypothetical protein